MSKRRVQLKDRILDNVAKAIKEVQRLYFSQDTDDVSPITDEDRSFQRLVEHIDHAFLHGLRVITAGYWGVVQRFTHKDIIADIMALNRLVTDFGRGRAWLYLALKETSLESYIRCVLDHPKLVQSYYHEDAILRDKQRLILLQTLVSGLDFVQFDPEMNNAYLDLVSHIPLSATKLDDETEEDYFNYDTASISSSGSATNIKETMENLTTEQQSMECSGETIHGEDDLDTDCATNYYKSTKHNILRTSSVSSDVASKITNDDVDGSSMKGYDYHIENAIESIPKIKKPNKSLDALLEKTNSNIENSDNIKVFREESITDLTDSLEVIHIVEKKSKKMKRTKKKSKTTIKKERDESVSLNSEDGAVSINSEDSWSSSHGTPRSFSDNVSFSSLGESIRSEDLINTSSFTHSDNPSPSLKVFNKDSSILAGHLNSPSVADSLGQPSIDDSGVCNNFLEPGVDSVLPRNSSKDKIIINEPSNLFNANLVKDEDRSSKPSNLFKTSHEQEIKPSEGQVVCGSEKQMTFTQNLDTGVCERSDVETDGLFQEKRSQPDGSDESFDELVENIKDSDKNLHDGSYESLFVSPVHTKSEEADKPSMKSAESASSSVCLEDNSLSQSFSDKESLQESRASAGDGSNVVELNEGYSEQGELESVLNAGATSISVSMQPEPDIDMKLDNNSKLFLMLEIFKNESEEFRKMFHLNTGHAEGDLQPVFILLTDQALYLLRKGDSDLAYSTETRVQYNDLDYISVSLNYQVIQLVCINRRKQYWLSSGCESSIRYFLHELKQVMKAGSRTKRLPSILTDATTQKIAMSKFVAEQSNCEMADVQILLYSLVHWEDLTNSLAAPDLQLYRSPVVMEGKLDYRVPGSALFSAYWKPCYCLLKHDTFHKFAQKDSLEPDLSVQLRSNRFGGCRRVRNGERQYAFELILDDGSSLQVACESEMKVSDWLQAICTIVAQNMSAKIDGNSPSPCQPCCLVVSESKLLLCHEDCQTQFYRLLASCQICSIASLEIDDKLQSYSIIKFEIEEKKNPWVFYFTSAAEKQKFEIAISESWQKSKQDVLPIIPIEEEKVKKRCQECFLLIQSSWQRSDSLLRGRVGGNIW